MRLDHLLSRETAKAEMPELIPRSMRMETSVKESGKAAKHEKCESDAGEQADRNATALKEKLLNAHSSVSFSGFGTCTLTTAQQRKKRFRKRPVASPKGLVRETIGLRIKRRKNQATKSTGWMPWHHTPKKDVASCDKLRGAASRHRSVDIRMGKPGR